MGATTFGVYLLLAQALEALFCFLALLAPSYHEQWIILPDGSSVNVSLSLFKVYMFSDCVSMWADSSAPSLMCKTFMHILNGLSLPTLQSRMCTVSLMSLSFLESGCSDITNILWATYFLRSILCFSCLLAVMAIIGTLAFTAEGRSLATRRAVLILHVALAMCLTVGVICYTMLGGQLHQHIVLRNVSHPGLETPQHHFSFAAGFVVCMTALLWAWILPGFAAWCMKIKYCSDRPLKLRKDEPNERSAFLMGKALVGETNRLRNAEFHQQFYTQPGVGY